MDNVPRKKVRFRVADLVHPHPAQILLELFQELFLEGEEAARTDDGNAPYSVVRVAGIPDPVIVPLDKVQPVE